MFANRPTHYHWWLALIGLVLGFAAPAVAQLTPGDIEALQTKAAAENWTFTMGENDATRRSLDELCGLVVPPEWWRGAPADPCFAREDLPSAYNCCDLGYCTPIRDQESCGSCWAFAAIGSLESWLLINGYGSQDLSEQWLVSCTDAGDCTLGGWHHWAYEYLLCDGKEDPCGDSGAVLESAFAYVAKNDPCNCPYTHPYCMPSWAFVCPATPEAVPTVDQIKQAIYDHGPVSAAVYVNDAFQAYTAGVFGGSACEDEQVNHAIVLVGWDDDKGENGAWRLRNSWGTTWGVSGYMWIEYGCSRVGYAAAFVGDIVDCNMNGVADAQDISSGTSSDCNEDGVPDECQFGLFEDCNTNGVPDDCDVDPTDPDGDGQWFLDTDGDGVPDVCDPSHDNCISAVDVSGGVTNLYFATTYATPDASSPCTTGPNIWYRLQVPASAAFWVKPVFVSVAADFDVKLAIYDGWTCSPLGTTLHCVDGPGWSAAYSDWFTSPGDLLLIEIGGVGAAFGEGLLSAHCGLQLEMVWLDDLDVYPTGTSVCDYGEWLPWGQP